MGKRASGQRVVKVQRQTLAKVFNCIFCAHENCVDVRINKADRVGYLRCKVCSVRFECRIHSLSAPIDVYANWVDESERVNQPASGSLGDSEPGRSNAEARAQSPAPARSRSRSPARSPSPDQPRSSARRVAASPDSDGSD